MRPFATGDLLGLDVSYGALIALYEGRCFRDMIIHSFRDETLRLESLSERPDRVGMSIMRMEGERKIR
jgi:hypothetical protein